MTPLVALDFAERAYSVTHMQAGGVEMVHGFGRDDDGPYVVMAFGGSRGLGDLFVDALGLPWYSPRLGVFVHSGILRGVEEFWRAHVSAVMRFLCGAGRLYLVGHSKGGMDARVVAGYLITAGHPPAGVITFGAPPVAFSGLRRLLDSAGVSVRSYVNGADYAPRLPLTWWYHRHSEIRIAAHGGGAPERVADLLRRPFADHGIAAYRQALRGGGHA